MRNMQNAGFRACLAIALLSLSVWAKAPFTFDTMMKIARIDDPQLSPDGKLVVFTVQTVDMANNNKPSQIYVVDVEGGTPRRLTNEAVMNTRPRWMPRCGCTATGPARCLS